MDSLAKQQEYLNREVSETIQRSLLVTGLMRGKPFIYLSMDDFLTLQVHPSMKLYSQAEPSKMKFVYFSLKYDD